MSLNFLEQHGVTANRRILVIDDSPIVVEALRDGAELPEEELAERGAGADGYTSRRRGVEEVLAEIRAWLTDARQRRHQEA